MVPFSVPSLQNRWFAEVGTSFLSLEMSLVKRPSDADRRIEPFFSRRISVAESPHGLHRCLSKATRSFSKPLHRPLTDNARMGIDHHCPIAKQKPEVELQVVVPRKNILNILYILGNISESRR